MNESSNPSTVIGRGLRVLGWILLILLPIYAWVVVNAPTGY